MRCAHRRFGPTSQTTRPGRATRCAIYRSRSSLRRPSCFRPFAEQNRIVEKVEALLAAGEYAARERLTRVREILKRFRQSVLAAACSGRLTEEWRAAGHPDGEPAMASSCNIGSQRDSFAPSFEHRPEDELPLTCRYVPLASLGEWRSGGTPAKGQSLYWSGGTVPWVSPKDMKSSSIGSSQDLVTEPALRETRLPRVPPNSLLFVVRGMILAHTFPVGLTTCPVTFNQDIRALRLNPRYLLLALQYEARHILFAVKEATHGTLRIDADTLWPWPVPLPPRKEQDEIGRRVEELFGAAAAVEERFGNCRRPRSEAPACRAGQGIPRRTGRARGRGDCRNVVGRMSAGFGMPSRSLGITPRQDLVGWFLVLSVPGRGDGLCRQGRAGR